MALQIIFVNEFIFKLYRKAILPRIRLGSVILTIESGILVLLSYEDAIKSFANKKPRR